MLILLSSTVCSFQAGEAVFGGDIFFRLVCVLEEAGGAEAIIALGSRTGGSRGPTGRSVTGFSSKNMSAHLNCIVLRNYIILQRDIFAISAG